jgi:cytochrome c553
MKKDLKNNRGLIHNFEFLSLRYTLHALCSMLSAHVSKLLVLSSVLLALLILCWIFLPNRANSGPYLDSAHGDTADGVNRSSLSSFNYSIGNCAHCHEQHASIGGSEPAPDTGDDTGPDIYLLFGRLSFPLIQNNVFCFLCHVEIDSYQSGGQVLNYSYSHQAGGDSETCPDSIKEAFHFINNDGTPLNNCSSNVGSSHRLQDIRGLLSGNWGFSSTGQNVDPCSGCHNPHRAQKDPHTSGRIISGKLLSAVSRPSQHTDLTTWELWGDDASERMNAYTPYYWAPKRALSGYEPDTTSTQDGSNLVDYVSLCTDCHNKTRVIYSNVLDRDLYRINWGADGDFHGTRPRNDGPGDRSGDDEWGDLLQPYKVGSAYTYSNYVLSCTDCHEPHGSPNEFLLRKTINGVQEGVINGEGQWYNWCQDCHLVYWNPPAPPGYSVHPPMDTDSDCFSGGGCHRHCDGTPCTLEGTLM